MEDRRTICLLNDSFPPLIDGVANTVVNYAKNIEAHHGHAVVATPAVKEADDSPYSFPVVRYPSLDTRKRFGYVAGYPFSPEVAQRLRDENAALLHSHCPVTSTILARELRGVLKVPLVMTYHTKYDIDIAKMLRGRLLQSGAVLALAQNIVACDEVWVVSRGAAENMKKFLGREVNWTLMPNGVDVPRGRVDEQVIADTVKDYDLPAGLPVFLFVGRMMWYKNVRIILDALARLRDAGADFRMVFVGDGADASAIRAHCSELKLEGKCFFTGAIYDRETIRAWYARSDLFLFPSTYDTNGLVVREAAASGTATVMVAGSCAAEEVTDGKNGFFIEENPASLAAKLLELCAAPEAMARVGENAENQLYLSWEDAVNLAWDRYGTVIDNYKRGLYPKHRKPLDGILRSQGEIMDTFAMIEEVGDEMRCDLAAERDELLSIFRARRQGATERFRAGREGAMKRLRAGQAGAKARIKGLWSRMDRYL